MRNIYDDEHTSLAYVHLTVPQIIDAANSGDVHPPGMYLLAHFTFKVIPSPRWMTVFVLLALYCGLTIFVLSVAPLLPTLGGRVCFLALATLNPQLLMWGLTIRWYGWWTPLALITLVYALQPGLAERLPVISYARAVGLGVLVTALFYISYITLIFVAALGIAMFFRYRGRPWRQYATALSLFTVLVSPQLHAFRTVHMAGGSEQRSNLAVSLARLTEGVCMSEAYLPWHPIAIVTLLVFATLFIAAIVHYIRKPGSSGAAFNENVVWQNRGLMSVMLFSFSFFVLVALSGLGGKPRNALIVSPTLAPFFALVVGDLASYPWASKARWLPTAVIAIFLLWEGVGIEHLLRRQGLAKANMNNHPEEVVDFIRRTMAAEAQTSCAVLITYDSLLTLTAEESHLPHLLLLAPPDTTLSLHHPVVNRDACNFVDIFWVISYLGGLGETGRQAAREMLVSESSLAEPIETHNLNFDPDAPWKRKLTILGNTGDLPDYRYIVQSARIPANELAPVLKRLPDFAAADGPE